MVKFLFYVLIVPAFVLALLIRALLSPFLPSRDPKYRSQEARDAEAASEAWRKRFSKK